MTDVPGPVHHDRCLCPAVHDLDRDGNCCHVSYLADFGCALRCG